MCSLSGAALQAQRRLNKSLGRRELRQWSSLVVPSRLKRLGCTTRKLNMWWSIWLKLIDAAASTLCRACKIQGEASLIPARASDAGRIPFVRSCTHLQHFQLGHAELIPWAAPVRAPGQGEHAPSIFSAEGAASFRVPGNTVHAIVSPGNTGQKHELRRRLGH